MGRTLAPTLVRLDSWATSIRTEPLKAAQRNGWPKTELPQSSSIIEEIAIRLVGQRKDAGLLSKSLQEALFYCVGFDANISVTRFANKFARYLNHHGTGSFIQRFLALFFFNYVWSETRDSFMALAETPSDIEKDIESVERVCQRAVASIWKSFENAHRPLNSAAATELVRGIEESLRG